MSRAMETKGAQRRAPRRPGDASSTTHVHKGYSWDEQPEQFTRRRHLAPLEYDYGASLEEARPQWRIANRKSTVGAVITLCLNVGIDPPTLRRPTPCARLQGWMAPKISRPRESLKEIGLSVQRQYSHWQRSKASHGIRFRVCLDPSEEMFKRTVCNVRNAAKKNRVLFHYNGQGTPEPSVSGELWVYNEKKTKYIPISIWDIQDWVKVELPSIFVFDCPKAGLLVGSFVKFVNRRRDVLRREYEKALHNYDMASRRAQLTRRSHTAAGSVPPGSGASAGPSSLRKPVGPGSRGSSHRPHGSSARKQELAARRRSTLAFLRSGGAGGGGGGRVAGGRRGSSEFLSTATTGDDGTKVLDVEPHPEGVKKPPVSAVGHGLSAPEPPPQFDSFILLGACGSTQTLPLHAAYLPADLFTACLTSPVPTALRWWIYHSSLAQQDFQLLFDNFDAFGSPTNRLSPIGHLMWAFTAVTDAIAWNRLPRSQFHSMFRQDMMVSSLARNFLLAQRVFASLDRQCVSYPLVPDCSRHPLWACWDMAVDNFLQQYLELVRSPARARQSLRCSSAEVRDDGAADSSSTDQRRSEAGGGPACAPLEHKRLGGHETGGGVCTREPVRLRLPTAEEVAAVRPQHASRKTLKGGDNTSPVAHPNLVAAAACKHADHIHGPGGTAHFIDEFAKEVVVAASEPWDPTAGDSSSGREASDVVLCFDRRRRVCDRMRTLASLTGHAPPVSDEHGLSLPSSEETDETPARQTSSSAPHLCSECRQRPVERKGAEDIASFRSPGATSAPGIRTVVAPPSTTSAQKFAFDSMATARSALSGPPRVVRLGWKQAGSGLPRDGRAVIESLDQLPSGFQSLIQPSRFFSEQLRSFQHKLKFLTPLHPPPLEVPIILQVMLSRRSRVQALCMLCNYVDRGGYAVEAVLSSGLHMYFLKLLAAPNRLMREALIFIWMKVLAADPSLVKLLKLKLATVFVRHLMNYPPPPPLPQAAHVLKSLQYMADTVHTTLVERDGPASGSRGLLTSSSAGLPPIPEGSQGTRTSNAALVRRPASQNVREAFQLAIDDGGATEESGREWSPRHHTSGRHRNSKRAPLSPRIVVDGPQRTATATEPAADKDGSEWTNAVDSQDHNGGGRAVVTESGGDSGGVDSEPDTGLVLRQELLVEIDSVQADDIEQDRRDILRLRDELSPERLADASSFAVDGSAGDGQDGTGDGGGGEDGIVGSEQQQSASGVDASQAGDTASGTLAESSQQLDNSNSNNNNNNNNNNSSSKTGGAVAEGQPPQAQSRPIQVSADVLRSHLDLHARGPARPAHPIDVRPRILDVLSSPPVVYNFGRALWHSWEYGTSVDCAQGISRPGPSDDSERRSRGDRGDPSPTAQWRYGDFVDFPMYANALCRWSGWNYDRVSSNASAVRLVADSSHTAASRRHNPDRRAGRSGLKVDTRRSTAHGPTPGGDWTPASTGRFLELFSRDGARGTSAGSAGEGSDHEVGPEPVSAHSPHSTDVADLSAAHGKRAGSARGGWSVRDSSAAAGGGETAGHRSDDASKSSGGARMGPDGTRSLRRKPMRRPNPLDLLMRPAEPFDLNDSAPSGTDGDRRPTLSPSSQRSESGTTRQSAEARKRRVAEQVVVRAPPTFIHNPCTQQMGALVCLALCARYSDSVRKGLSTSQLCPMRLAAALLCGSTSSLVRRWAALLISELWRGVDAAKQQGATDGIPFLLNQVAHSDHCPEVRASAACALGSFIGGRTPQDWAERCGLNAGGGKNTVDETSTAAAADSSPTVRLSKGIFARVNADTNDGRGSRTSSDVTPDTARWDGVVPKDWMARVRLTENHHVLYVVPCLELDLWVGDALARLWANDASPLVRLETVKALAQLVYWRQCPFMVEHHFLKLQEHHQRAAGRERSSSRSAKPSPAERKDEDAPVRQSSRTSVYSDGAVLGASPMALVMECWRRLMRGHQSYWSISGAAKVQRIWEALSLAAKDPSPPVASVACTVTQYIKRKCLKMWSARSAVSARSRLLFSSTSNDGKERGGSDLSVTASESGGGGRGAGRSRGGSVSGPPPPLVKRSAHRTPRERRPVRSFVRSVAGITKIPPEDDSGWQVAPSTLLFRSLLRVAEPFAPVISSKDRCTHDATLVDNHNQSGSRVVVGPSGAVVSDGNPLRPTGRLTLAADVTHCLLSPQDADMVLTYRTLSRGLSERSCPSEGRDASALHAMPRFRALQAQWDRTLDQLRALDRDLLSESFLFRGTPHLVFQPKGAVARRRAAPLAASRHRAHSASTSQLAVGRGVHRGRRGNLVNDVVYDHLGRRALSQTPSDVVHLPAAGSVSFGNTAAFGLTDDSGAVGNASRRIRDMVHESVQRSVMTPRPRRGHPTRFRWGDELRSSHAAPTSGTKMSGDFSQSAGEAHDLVSSANSGQPWIDGLEAAVGLLPAAAATAAAGGSTESGSGAAEDGFKAPAGGDEDVTTTTTTTATTTTATTAATTTASAGGVISHEQSNAGSRGRSRLVLPSKTVPVRGRRLGRAGRPSPAMPSRRDISKVSPLLGALGAPQQNSRGAVRSRNSMSRRLRRGGAMQLMRPTRLLQAKATYLADLLCAQQVLNEDSLDLIAGSKHSPGALQAASRRYRQVVQRRSQYKLMSTIFRAQSAFASRTPLSNGQHVAVLGVGPNKMREIDYFRGRHEDCVDGLLFHSFDPLLVSAHRGNVLCVWSYHSESVENALPLSKGGRPVVALNTFRNGTSRSSRITSMNWANELSGEGLLVVGTDDGSVRVWSNAHLARKHRLVTAFNVCGGIKGGGGSGLGASLSHPGVLAHSLGASTPHTPASSAVGGGFPNNPAAGWLVNGSVDATGSSVGAGGTPMPSSHRSPESAGRSPSVRGSAGGSRSVAVPTHSGHDSSGSVGAGGRLSALPHLPRSAQSIAIHQQPASGTRAVAIAPATASSRYRRRTGRAPPLVMDAGARTGTLLASGCAQSTISLWDLQSERRVRTMPVTALRSSVDPVVWSGRPFALGSYSGCHVVSSLKGFPAYPSLFVAGTGAGWVSLYDCRAPPRSCVVGRYPHSAPVIKVGTRTDAESGGRTPLIVAGCASGKVSLWDPREALNARRQQAAMAARWAQSSSNLASHMGEKSGASAVVANNPGGNTSTGPRKPALHADGPLAPTAGTSAAKRRFSSSLSASLAAVNQLGLGAGAPASSHGHVKRQSVAAGGGGGGNAGGSTVSGGGRVRPKSTVHTLHFPSARQGLTAPQGAIDCLAVHPLHDMVVCGSYERKIQIMDLSGNSLQNIEFHYGASGRLLGPLVSLAMHPLQPVMAVGSSDSSVVLYAANMNAKKA